MKNKAVHFYFFMLLLLNGCTKQIKVAEQPIDFQFVKVEKGDTFRSLAKRYLGSERLAWRLHEFNNRYHLSSGQQLIIPLTAFRPGGLTAYGYQLVPVLSYHNFSETGKGTLLTVTADNFRKQLGYLMENNFHVITLDQLNHYLNFGQLPKKSVLITLDDGWKSSYQVAYPLLKAYGYNATLFIPTKFINSGHRLALTWDQLREMVSDDKIDIQCHTKSHRDLSTHLHNESFSKYLKAVETDILSSKQTIYEELGKQVTALAYPYGKTNLLVQSLLKKQGYSAAFTVKREGNPFFRQPFKLNRSMIFGTFSLNRYVKNLKYYEEKPIAKPEPIDRLNSLATIASSQPEQYENRQQWRTALLAWKLRRDKLISQKQLGAQLDKQSVFQLEQSIKQAKQKVMDIKLKLQKIAKVFFLQALNKIKKGEDAQALLLKSLLYDPENAAPLDLFHSNMGRLELLSYEVKQKDNFKSIARQFYQDTEKAALIPLFNEGVQEEKKLTPGISLQLPALPVEKKKVVRKRSRKCSLTLTQHPKKIAIQFYNKAMKHFNQGHIAKSIENLKTAVCLDPTHQQAKELLEMLRAI